MALARHGCLDFVGATIEIDAGRLVGVRIQWCDGGGDFVLIDGYREFSSEPIRSMWRIHIAPPAFLCSADVSGESNVSSNPGNGPSKSTVGGGASGSGILAIGPIVVGAACAIITIDSEIHATPGNPAAPALNREESES